MEFILLICTVLTLLFIYLRFWYRYWEHRGIPQLKGRSALEIFLQHNTQHGAEMAHKVYEEFKGKADVAGDYIYFSPVAYILDLDLVKHVLIKDFNNFTNRFSEEGDGINPITKNLFRLLDDSWRQMRAKISPTFTSAKMKYMLTTIVGVAEKFDELYDKELKASEGGVLEVYDMSARFTTDVIGVCIFGAECNSLNNPDNEFRRLGKLIFHSKRSYLQLHLFLIQYSKYFKFFGHSDLEAPVLNIVMNFVKETVKMREEQNIKRNDFMNLLIELRNKKDENGNYGLTIEEIAAQSFIFFAAGYETSSSLMSFCLFELAKNPSIQNKLRAEIKTILNEHNGELTAEAINNMNYLNKIISETMRKYPALPTLKRIAQTDYKVPGSNMIIPKGTLVMIPVKEIHHDASIYEEPNEFRPERFDQEEVNKRHPHAFLPFGDGPRNCIGLRFGNIQARVGLITLLKKYEFNVCKKTPERFELTSHALVFVPNSGVYLKVTKIDQ